MNTILRLLTRQRIGALLFLALSLFYGWQIPEIPRLPVDELEAMNARSMPWALAILGVVLSLALLFSGGIGHSAKAAQDSGADAVVSSPANVFTAIGLLGWTALYANLLGWLGFLLATAAFLAGGFWLLGERRPRILGGVAVAVALILFGLLRIGLGLYLPEGSVWLQWFGGVDV